MANSRNEAVKPLPFPGESPTVALAMAAGQKYGLHPEDEKPKRAARKPRAAAKKKAAPRKAGAKKAAPRKAATAKAARRKGARSR